MNWLTSYPIAHRGLHDEASPKNSLSAFEKAIKKGLPFEIDVRLTVDEVLVVCHDDEIEDAFGHKFTVTKTPYSELQSFNLSADGQKIPRFTDVLELTKGQVGILIEIKNFSQNRRTEEVLVKELEGYTGPYAIQSFNPLSIGWLKKNGPKAQRGVLSCSFDTDEQMSKMRRFLLSNLLLNPIARPDFIAYDEHDLPKGAVHRCKKPVLAWTVTSEERAWDLLNNGLADNMIFEDFVPSEKLIEKILKG